MMGTGGLTCCSPISPSWESVTVCLGEDQATRSKWLSLDAGKYGSYELLARMEPAIITIQYYRARLVQRIAFDPGCRKAPPSPACPAEENVWEELNATIPIGARRTEPEQF